MNKIKNRFKGLVNRYTLLLLFTYFVFGVGFSYAYFAYQYENTTAIVGNVVAIDADLEVELVTNPTNNTKMVPMQNGALTNAINGVGGQSVCIDANGNLSCQVYKITLTNNASRLQHVTGTIELYAKNGASNVYNNLRWQELTNPTTVKEGSNVNRMGKSILEADITMESGETREWYIAVWISEMDYNQVNTDKGQFGGTVTFEVLELSENFSNAPNLDNGNLIPVYYDDTTGVEKWRKADSTNANNSWYDYENKMWANAVIIDPDASTDYSTQSNGTVITDSDIIAFYVWIPRYKYRVWNITRQGGAESTYAYQAYSKGIDIEFEYFEGNTGNVECIYDVTSVELETNLSDKCYYNGSTTPIATTDLNTNYTDAWYTHPAFIFGGEEKEGFWIGKFETGNTDDTPKVLPDVSSLRNQNVSTQFTTSKKFQNYLSSEIDAHMLTNLEWGAVAYLSHSIYGLCNGTTCQGMYINNSSGYFTGRSGGAIAGSDDLNLANVYPDDTAETTKYNTNGYYTYKGYFIDYSGNVTTTKDTSEVASTTGNITGVYDMNGGAYEYVMGNMVNSNGNFSPSTSGTSWNGSSTLDSIYYNSYSYGTKYYKALAFNRARLGDATAEVLGSSTSETGSWKIGSGITGSNSYFTNYSNSWFRRGGYYGITDSGPFEFYRSVGNINYYHSFRSSIS